jgi:hypothetical protein
MLSTSVSRMSTEKLKTKDLPALETLRICSNCIQEKYLKDQVSRTNIVAECAYCKEHNPTISLGDLADLLETAIDTHYWFCHRGEVSEWDVETMSEGTERFGWDTPMLHVEDLIASVARIKPAPAEQVRKVLNIRYCGSDPGPGHDKIAFERGSEYYRRAPKSDEFSALWNSFEHSLKTETRHFNHAAEDKLRTIFAGVEQLSTRDGKPVVVTAGPGERLNAFFRARLFQSERVLAWALQSPETSLGPPPDPIGPVA